MSNVLFDSVDVIEFLDNLVNDFGPTHEAPAIYSVSGQPVCGAGHFLAQIGVPHRVMETRFLGHLIEDLHEAGELRMLTPDAVQVLSAFQITQDGHKTDRSWGNALKSAHAAAVATVVADESYLPEKVLALL